MNTNFKRVFNPPNPYLSEHQELIGESPAVEPEIYEDLSKSVLTKNDSPDLDFRWSVNPYRGCFHACAYCYARPSHEYLGLGAGTDFESKIFVKVNAPELLRKALSKRTWRRELIVFSGITDCYQPAEAAWKLTRRCLEVCLDFANPVAIITKSALIRRDADVLAALAKKADVTVTLSIPFRDEETARVIEPGAPTIRKRFETMKILADAKVPVGIGVAPVIPGLNEQDIPYLLREAKDNGASHAFKTLLRLPGNVKEVFFRELEAKLPLKRRAVENRIREVRSGRLSSSVFGARHHGRGEHWNVIEQSWDVWTRKYGFGKRERMSPDATLDIPNAAKKSKARKQLQQEFNFQ